MNTHINDVKYEYKKLDDAKHIKTTICKGCTTELTVTNDDHDFVNNTCDLCNYERHSHIFNKEIVNDDTKKNDASCTVAATYYYSCGCGEVGTSTFTVGEALGHSYIGKETKAPTCTSDGVRTFTCSCGHSYTQPIAKYSHSFTAKVVSASYLKTDANCNSPAVYYFKCSGCNEKGGDDDTYTDGNKNELNHVGTTTDTYQQNNSNVQHKIVTICNTCTKTIKSVDGTHTFDANNTCTLCTQHVHKFEVKDTNNKYVDKSATCTTKATYFYKCVGCDAKGTETYEFGEYASHIWTNNKDEQYIKVAATCNAVATYYKSCLVCGT
jgi:hypothetical protein